MTSADLRKQLESGEFIIPKYKAGKKISGVVIQRGDYGALIDCEWGAYTGIILSKEVKNLERNGEDLAIGTEVIAEFLGSDIMTDEGFYVVSISKLRQKDVLDKMMSQQANDEVFTVIPTEANLWGLLVDMHGIKWFIPLSQLAPINYPRVEDGDQEKIFDALLELLGKEFKVRIINFDEDGRRMILSEREAMREERTALMDALEVGNEYEGVISGLSSYGFFVTIGADIEGLVHISEITYGHVSNIDGLGDLWEKMKVKVIGLEDGKISLSAKQLKPDPWSLIPQKYQVGDVIEGEVVRYVPYGVFIRVFDDINGLIHMSEIGEIPGATPGQWVRALRLWSVVRAKLITLEPHKRRIGLSIKAAKADERREAKEKAERQGE